MQDCGHDHVYSIRCEKLRLWSPNLTQHVKLEQMFRCILGLASVSLVGAFRHAKSVSVIRAVGGRNHGARARFQR